MFNFLKNLKSKQNSSFELFSAISGKTIRLSQVPDSIFSKKLAGDGIAIDPIGDTVVSPADGELALIFNTKHAFILTLENGIEVLVHIGLDIVNLNSNGFELLVQQGEKVKAGTPIIKLNRDYIMSKGFLLITLILITNMDKVLSITNEENIDTIGGQTIITKYTT